MGDGDSLVLAALMWAIGLWAAFDCLPIRNRARWTLLARGVGIVSLLFTLFAVDIRVPWPLLEEISAGVCAILLAFGIYNAGRWPPPGEDDKSSPT